MLTMHADKEVLTNAIRAGASGYLVKDCSTSEIAEAVRMAAGGDTVLSPQLAKSMLDEVRRLDQQARTEEERTVTKREEEVLQLIADGCSTPEVAERLYISPEDREEPPGVDLPEARRPRPHPGRPAGGPHGHRPAPLAGRRRQEMLQTGNDSADTTPARSR